MARLPAKLRSTMTPAWITALLVCATGCARPTGERATEYVHRFTQPAERAAYCFARNAEAHSSALVSDVSTRQRDRFDVVVRVKNGTTYAVARIAEGARGATGTINLYVVSSRGNRELLGQLVEGC